MDVQRSDYVDMSPNLYSRMVLCLVAIRFKDLNLFYILKKHRKSEKVFIRFDLIYELYLGY